ncbi:unnamed protein product [Nyctereutes procyonoides]|uniref:(raccoon dog) hypothetical protein n=1 Tax=Nyctereutes procyonoides TaxID=34880 RepID=A0A811Y6E1_NYCPR|nr:unnamed protein product [Nyctereutes procyonoides]
MGRTAEERLSAREAGEIEDKVTSLEKTEEAKLKTRYSHLGQKLERQKYFDSGDYNMAKAKMNQDFEFKPHIGHGAYFKNKKKKEKRKEKHHLPTAVLDKTEVTGDHIPTPQDCPQQKPCLSLASWLAH